MAPRQTTIQQSEAMVKQILTLIDTIDYKTLNALFDLYRDRVVQEEALIASLGTQNKTVDNMTIEAHRKAYYDMKLIQLINKFKSFRQRLREEYLSEKGQ